MTQRVGDGAVVVIGNFDGVHRGHQAVLAQARAVADARGLACKVLTFDPHPAVVLGRPGLPRLMTVARRVELLEAHGADAVVVERFTTELAAWSPERFASDLLRARLGARAVVVGKNFRFGHARAGSFETLRSLGVELGFDAIAADVAGDHKGRFSSTRVRDAVLAGDLDEARAVLGRPHSLSGVVEHGDRLGRTIGFPTANLGGVVEVLPPHGVYAVRVDEIRAGAGADQALAGGAMNLGVRPTVTAAGASAPLRIEVNLFDFDRDLYGARLRVHLVARLRGEKKLAGLDALKAQIALDVAEARRILAAG
jgi:riboflavin kinase/FMN adenylyltransferase